MPGVPHVQVRIGACHIAIAVAHAVQAVALPAAGLTRLPRREGALVGLLDSALGAVPVVALDRWVDVGAGGDPARARVLVMRAGRSLVGIQVDAVLGVQRIDAACVRRVHHDSSDEELFQAVVPAHDKQPLLCLLEVERLLKLCTAWCEDAGMALPPADPSASASASAPGPAAAPGPGPGPGPAAAAAAASGAGHRRPGLRHALLDVRGELWAVPAGAIAQVGRTPLPELQWAGQRTCGIGTWRGRKLPLVDLAAGAAGLRTGMTAEAGGAGSPVETGGAGSPVETGGAARCRPWMAVVEQGRQWIGLLATACEQFVDIAPGDIEPDTGGSLRAGTAVVPVFGKIGVLDTRALFAAVPEAAISDAGVAGVVSPGGRSTGSAENSDRIAEKSADTSADTSAAPTHYLVFEADRRYVAPARGVIGVTALPPLAVAALNAGRRTTVAWRGVPVSVVNLPALNGDGPPACDPRYAVIVQGTGGGAPSGIAVRDLTDWVPANSARRSGLRMGSVGDMTMVTMQRSGSRGKDLGASLVVVDLTEIAELLN